MSVDYVISEARTVDDVDRADIGVSKDGVILKDRYGNAATVLAGLSGPAASIKKLKEDEDALIEALGAVINLLPKNQKQMILRELAQVASR